MGSLLPFDACWARYDRADEHRTRLPSIWNDYIADHPFDFSLTHRGEGVHVLEAFEKWPIPADFVLELGGWLYQVRSCLDFIVWATAVYDSGESPPPDEDRLQYPICATEKRWRENLRRLQPLHDDHLKMLHAVQPFQGDPDANWLAMINRLARVDRHRRLNVGTAYIAETDPYSRCPTAETSPSRREASGSSMGTPRCSSSPFDLGPTGTRSRSTRAWHSTRSRVSVLAEMVARQAATHGPGIPRRRDRSVRVLLHRREPQGRPAPAGVPQRA